MATISQVVREFSDYVEAEAELLEENPTKWSLAFYNYYTAEARAHFGLIEALNPNLTENPEAKRAALKHAVKASLSLMKLVHLLGD